MDLNALGNNLVWRIGKDEISGKVIVRVGMASSAWRWTRLPKLRNISDAEISEALKTEEIITEWVE